MNLLDPSFGTTRLDEEELAYMTDSARQLLGDDPTKAAVYDLEQQLQSIVTERAMKDAMSAI